MVRGIKKAMAALKSDPSQPVTAEIDDLDDLIVEMRVTRRRTAGDIFREAGPWEGESQEELIKMLREARDQGGSKEMPQF